MGKDREFLKFCEAVAGFAQNMVYVNPETGMMYEAELLIKKPVSLHRLPFADLAVILPSFIHPAAALCSNVVVRGEPMDRNSRSYGTGLSASGVQEQAPSSPYAAVPEFMDRHLFDLCLLEMSRELPLRSVYAVTPSHARLVFLPNASMPTHSALSEMLPLTAPDARLLADGVFVWELPDPLVFAFFFVASPTALVVRAGELASPEYRRRLVPVLNPGSASLADIKALFSSYNVYLYIYNTATQKFYVPPLPNIYPSGILCLSQGSPPLLDQAVAGHSDARLKRWFSVAPCFTALGTFLRYWSLEFSRWNVTDLGTHARRAVADGLFDVDLVAMRVKPSSAERILAHCELVNQTLLEFAAAVQLPQRALYYLRSFEESRAEEASAEPVGSGGGVSSEHGGGQEEPPAGSGEAQ